MGLFRRMSEIKDQCDRQRLVKEAAVMLDMDVVSEFAVADESKPDEPTLLHMAGCECADAVKERAQWAEWLRSHRDD